jgi:hypothetical protein
MKRMNQLLNDLVEQQRGRYLREQELEPLKREFEKVCN